MKKWFEFSKLLVMGVTLAFALGLIIGTVAVLRDGQSLGELLVYIGAPFATVTTMYLVKAKAENVLKIGNHCPTGAQGFVVDGFNTDTEEDTENDI